MNTKQTGDLSFVTSAQNGLSNVALYDQHDGQSYVGQQGLGALGGSNNQIDVQQMGPDGVFSTADCSFDMQMGAMPINDVPVLEIDDICPDC